jgi:hypothetical protein
MVDGKSGEEAYENPRLSGQLSSSRRKLSHYRVPDLLVFPVNSMYGHIASLICF